ncbi:response regulator, partial [Arthrospira platensis SPKY2]
MATILVVDDYLVTQKILFFQLGKIGHQVVTANHGREALDYLKGEKVDLILLDLAMPEMDGLTMLEHLRKD